MTLEFSSTHSADFLDQDQALQRLARHLLRNADADDVVQETWLAAVRAGWQRALSQPAWLRSVLRKQALYARRQEMRRREYERDHVVERERDAQAVAGSGAGALLRQYVAALREPHASVVHLHYWEGASVREIAERLQRPVGTIKGQLAKGLEELRIRLELESRRQGKSWVPGLVAFLQPRAVVVPALRARKSSLAPLAPAALSASLLCVLLAPLLLPLLTKAWVLAPKLAQADAADEPIKSGERTLGAGVDERVALELNAAPSTITTTLAAPGQHWSLLVLDPTGAPLPGALVYCNEGPQALPSDERGCVFWKCSAVPEDSPALDSLPGFVRFQAVHQAYLPTFQHAIHADEFRGEQIVLQFEHAAQVIRGRVQDAGGAGVAAAKVALFDHAHSYKQRADGVVMLSGYASTNTDEEGNFTLAGHLGLGQWLTVQREGFAPFDSEPSALVGAGELCQIVLQAGAQLQGSVQDCNGQPVAGAIVRFATCAGTLWTTVTADAQGRYACNSLPEGELCLWALDPQATQRYKSELLSFRVDQPTIWNPRLAEHQQVEFRVLDDAGLPAANLGVQVRVGDWVSTQLTDADGRTPAFVGFPDDRARVLVCNARVPLAIPLLTLEEILLREPYYELRLPPDAQKTAPVSGHVQTASGEPIGRDVILTLHDLQSCMLVPWLQVDNATGFFQTDPQPPGLYAISAFVEGQGIYLFPAFERAPASAVDLGVLSLPATGEVVIDLPPALSSQNETTVEYSYRYQIGGRLRELSAGATPLSTPGVKLSLLPGEYIFRLKQGPEELATAELCVRSEQEHLVLWQFHNSPP